jgi:tellurite resistance protein
MMPTESSLKTTMTMPLVPAAFFGMVLGLGGLAITWRTASLLWASVPRSVGEAIGLVAVLVWAVVTFLYALKWMVAREQALAEAEHPVQCCFIGLAGVSTMLVAMIVLPYSAIAAWIFYLSGAAFTLLFALWRTGRLWHGARDATTTTAVLYLPTVAGSFMTAIGASTLGHSDWGQLAFGAGFFSWLAIESVLLNRLLTAPEMAIPLRSSMGIQLAPPAVGCAAYLSVTTGVPDVLAHAMMGYAILQALLLFRLLPWIMRQPLAASYWGATFGATALATAALRMAARGDTGVVLTLAPILFVLANIVVGLIAVGTVYLLVRRKLVPAPLPAQTVTP